MCRLIYKSHVYGGSHPLALSSIQSWTNILHDVSLSRFLDMQLDMLPIMSLV